MSFMLTLDLNLLAIFDAVHELRSVTRAAERLGLTQSAVSHALRRLRDTVGDPLFVRDGRRLQPTARATEMAPAVRDGLAHLRGAVAPAASTRGPRCGASRWRRGPISVCCWCRG